jgi:hypothetical protein
MTTQFMDTCVEGTGRAHGGVNGQRTRNNRGGIQVVDGEQVPQCQRGRGLGAVEQRETFLRGQLEPLQPGALQPLVRAQHLAGALHFPHA